MQSCGLARILAVICFSALILIAVCSVAFALSPAAKKFLSSIGVDVGSPDVALAAGDGIIHTDYRGGTIAG
jgi:hypothetical protein